MQTTSNCYLRRVPQYEIEFHPSLVAFMVTISVYGRVIFRVPFVEVRSIWLAFMITQSPIYIKIISFESITSWSFRVIELSMY